MTRETTVVGIAYTLGLVTASLAKFLIFSRTTLIPRSSEALSSRTLVLINSGLHEMKGQSSECACRAGNMSVAITHPKSCLASARMVEVFPVPGGP